MHEINEQLFEELVCNRLLAHWERGLTVFRNYGPQLSYDVTNVLMHAADQGKSEEVLGVLEVHFRDCLAYQHPDIRGTVKDGFGTNRTQVMFLDLCERVLALKPIDEC